MLRIERPDWARPPDIRRRGVSDEDFAAIQRHRDRMLRVVQREVEAYLNDPRLYFSGEEDGFPNRDRLTGEYYLGDESYTAHADPVWFQVKVTCRCLEKPRRPGDRADDYLGLEVWLRCVPGRWTFSVFRNTDSSSI